MASGLCRRDACATSGLMLVECLVYIAVFTVIMFLAFQSYYHLTAASNRMRATADDITKVMEIGERWRADVRLAVAPVSVAKNGNDEVIRIPQADRVVEYHSTTNAILRRAGDGAQLIPVTDRVSRSSFEKDARKRATAWRWELELQPKYKDTRRKTAMTFIAVPSMEVKQ